MYEERPSRLTGAVVWQRTLPAPVTRPVLPDGCMDLLWTDGRMLVAGPDTRPYLPAGGPARWAGVRFFPGTAPEFLGDPRTRCVIGAWTSPTCGPPRRCGA